VDHLEAKASKGDKADNNDEDRGEADNNNEDKVAMKVTVKMLLMTMSNCEPICGSGFVCGVWGGLHI